MVSFPHCKINLGLNVISKRADGYHDIETCFYPVPWTDVLEIIAASQTSFTTSGIVIPGNADENLCVKAYQLLRKDFDLPPVAIHLHKIIPTGAGLGGGSSDAAFTLRTLNERFNLGLSNVQLVDYAAQLGSDCAFFIDSKAKIGTGRGELLREINVDLRGKYLVMVKPDVHVSTADAYAGVIPAMPTKKIEEVILQPIASWKDNLINDFEISVFRKFPLLKQVKQLLYMEGADYASMSGSGSTVFGIFNAPVNLEGKFPGMTYWSGALI